MADVVGLDLEGETMPNDEEGDGTDAQASHSNKRMTFGKKSVGKAAFTAVSYTHLTLPTTPYV